MVITPLRTALTTCMLAQWMLGFSSAAAENIPTSYEERMEAALHDERIHIANIYTSRTGSIITEITGTMSAISSALIILVIFRSSIGLSTIYHRLLFGMSIADIMASIAMALTSLPMPKDMIYTQFALSPRGNTGTCVAPGFFFFVGSNLAFGYNAAHCLYYLCKIRYKMKEANIRKCMEPTMHILVLVAAVPNGIIFWIWDLYNPQPQDAWCTTAVYPWYCKQDETCSLRGSKYMKYGFFFVFIGFFLGALFLLGSMALIILAVVRQDRLLKKYIKSVYGRRMDQEDNAEENKNLAASRSRHHFTKVILCQAAAYCVAFFICQSNVFISLQRAFTAGNTRRNEWTQIYHLVTRPLQGFFNLLVFIGNKVYDLRQVNSDLTIGRAILSAFTVREEPRFVFSQISLVAHYGEEEEEELHFDGEDDGEDDGIDDAYEYDFSGPKSVQDESGVSLEKEHDDVDNPVVSANDGLSMSDTFEDNSAPPSGESLAPGSFFSRSTQNSLSACVSWAKPGGDAS